MWISVAFLILAVLSGKSIGSGYGYSRRPYGRGFSYGSSSDYGQGYSRGGRYRHYRGHEERHVPIQIPYIDRNGCRFPGDVVCDPAAADPPITYGLCTLSDENLNLWKKPSMQIVATDCVPVGTRVATDFCNDNERLLRAVGLIRAKDNHVRRHHQRKYSASRNPCILAV